MYLIKSPSFRVLVTSLNKIQIPNMIHEAIKVSEWKGSILEEINVLEKNKNWEIADLPSEKHPVGCKWIFTIKHKADGSVDRFKTQLVAKGLT